MGGCRYQSSASVFRSTASKDPSAQRADALTSNATYMGSSIETKENKDLDTRTFLPAQSHSLDGLNGRLNPPVRFIYCLYCVDFSLRMPDTSLPGIFLFWVLLKVEKPISWRSRASSLSSSPEAWLGLVPFGWVESRSMASVEGADGFCVFLL
jgi:hypothetical protein